MDVKVQQFPKILIISGTHGNESNAIQDVYDLKLRYAGCRDMELTFHQAWNKTGLKYGEREFQEEDCELPKDLNRAFISGYPETKEDLIEELKDEIEKNDVVIDVHNSPVVTNCVVINNGPWAKHYIDFCKEYKLAFIVIESDTDTIKKYAIDNHKVGFTVELGDMGFSDKKDGIEFLSKLLQALDNTWRLNGFWSFNRFKDCARTPCSAMEVSQEIMAHKDGLLRVIGPSGLGKESPTGLKPMYSEVLRHYMKGEVIFVIVNPDTETVEEIIEAPCNGTLIDLSAEYWAVKGTGVGTFQPDIEC